MYETESSNATTRQSLPLIEDLKDKNLSEISDTELQRALQSMHALNPQTKKVCGMRHEVYDIPAFCSDTGMLHCAHTHSFAVIEEAIHRLKVHDTVEAGQVKAKLLLLHSLTSKLEAMDMGAGYLEEEIDSAGHSGSELIPYFLDYFGLSREDILNKTPNEARVLLSQAVSELQTGIALEIDGIRNWAMENAPKAE